MSHRDLIRRILETVTDLDTPAKIKLLHRNANGLCIAEQVIEINHWSSCEEGGATIDAAKIKKTPKREPCYTQPKRLS